MTSPVSASWQPASSLRPGRFNCWVTGAYAVTGSMDDPAMLIRLCLRRNSELGGAKAARMAYAPLAPSPHPVKEYCKFHGRSYAFSKIGRLAAADLPVVSAAKASRDMQGPAPDQTIIQPGGGRLQTADPAAHLKQPPAVKLHQLAATVEGYRRQAFADGIPDRLPANAASQAEDCLDCCLTYDLTTPFLSTLKSAGLTASFHPETAFSGS